MESPVSKAEILRLITSERRALEDLLTAIGDEQMLASGMESGWSVKDVLAHIASWETNMVRWIDMTLRGERPDRPAPGENWDDLDAYNAELYEAHKNLGLEEVQTRFAQSHRAGLDALTRLSEEDLFDPDRFAWRNGQALWMMVAGNTWLHYAEHAASIREWRAAS